ncbi:MAG: NAD-dependent epimerase/dehydratase family protein, partial [Gemmatimonadota bacterium]|nr:NAD-dependent epimerase/dehydratase family protein [Gemmatimonadota bacterium]
VVTGSRGFIGSHLVEALVAEGARVRCLLRAGTTPELAAISGGAIEQVVVDYDDPSTLEKTRALDGGDYVFHLGGVTKGVGQREFDAGNIVPTARLIDALFARRHDGQLKRFVFVSSQAAAGPARSLDEPRDEAQPEQPIEEYGRSKLAAERVVASRGDRIPFTVARPSAVYGPRDRDFLVVFRQARHGVGLYPASRDRYLSVIHVRDVVRGMLAASRSAEAAGRTYFLTAEPPVSWRDVYRAAGAAVGRRMTEINIPQTLIDAAGVLGDVHAWLTGTPTLVTRQKITLSKAEYWVCSSARAQRDFGFRAGIGLREGMRETYRWYVEHKWLE